jgi:hypothetical protein
MEKNSSIYNNKRFAQRTDNYQDYERDPNIPEPNSRLYNWGSFFNKGIEKLMGNYGNENVYYPESISNAKAFRISSIFKYGSPTIKYLSEFVSYMTMLNNGNDSKPDSIKMDWLKANRQPVDQYNELLNWTQSERQKYSTRFNTMLGTSRGAILQKALIAMKNAEIAAAKEVFKNNQGVKEAKFISDAPADTADTSTDTSTDTSETKPTSIKPSRTEPSSSQSVSRPSEEKPEVPKYNFAYIKSIEDIEDGNQLLYHAAKRALGVREQNIDSYYTKENAKRIMDMIKKIADSDYMNKLNSKLRDLKKAALDKLEEKILSNIKPTPQPESPSGAEGTGTAGSMTTTTGPDGEQRVTSPVETEAGREVDRLLDIAEGLDNNQLKRLWKNMLDNINLLLTNPQIDNVEKVEFDQRIKDIILRYNLAFHPEGGRQLASGAFVVNTPEDLARILRAALKVKDTKAANGAIDQLKIIFEENPINVPLQQFKTILRREIKQYNFRNPEKQVNDLLR